LKRAFHQLRLSFLLSGFGLLLVLLPVGFLLLGSLATREPQAVPKWLLSSGSLELLLRSLLVAGATSLLSLLLGVPLALWWVAGHKRRWARLLLGLHLLPLSLPPYTVALGFAQLLGRLAPGAGAGFFYGPGGLTLVMTICLSPLVTLLVAAFAARLDGAALEAAALSRAPAPVLLRIVLPALLPAAALAALVVFVLTLGEVAVPQLLRTPSWAVTVFSRLADLSYAPAQATLRCLPLLFIAALVAAACQHIDRRARGSLGLRVRRIAPALLPSGLLWAGRLLAVLLALATVLSLATLATNGIAGPGGGLGALAASLPALANSLTYATTAALVMLVVAAPLGFYWSHSRAPATLATLPLLLGLVLPGVVLALGLVIQWNRPATSWLYGGTTVAVLGLVGHYLYLPLRAAKLGFDRFPRAWIDAARLPGRGPWQRLRTIYLPLSRRVLLTAGLLGLLLGLRDVDTLIVLYPPGGQTLTIRTLTLEANSPAGLTAAAALLQVGTTATLLWLLAHLRGIMEGRK